MTVKKSASTARATSTPKVAETGKTAEPKAESAKTRAVAEKATKTDEASAKAVDKTTKAASTKTAAKTTKVADAAKVGAGEAKVTKAAKTAKTAKTAEAAEGKVSKAGAEATKAATAKPAAKATKAATAKSAAKATKAATAKPAAKTTKAATTKVTEKADKASKVEEAPAKKVEAEPAKAAEAAKPAKKADAAKAAEKTAATIAAEVEKASKSATETAPAKKTTRRASAKKTAAQGAAEKKSDDEPAVAEKAVRVATAKKTSKAVPEKKAADAAKAPAEEAPAVKAPAEKAAPETASPEETPAEVTAAEASAKAPVEETPVAETPAQEQEAPVAEAPVQEQEVQVEAVSAEEAPVEEAPVDQPSDQPDFSGVGGVLIAAAECAPLVKVGGLADVVGALPKYLKKLGIDARIIMPLHRQVKERYFNEMQHMCDFQASLGWRSQYVGLERLELDGTVYYFIDNEFYFGGPIYCGGEFEGEQYAFFTRAVMDAIPQLDFDVRVLHCNDWHTAMMPLLAKTQYQGGMQSGLRTVLTIHNLHFQGQFSHEFDRDLLRVDDSLATPQFIEHYGCDNMLKAGIVFADKVTTVSPTYSQEICQPELGESLDGVLRSRGGDLWGILNGIDVDVWNPQTDPALPERYSTKSLWRKTKNRDALLEELGLAPAGENTAVIGMVGRLTPQKGIDLVTPVLDELMGEDVRVIVLGSGDADYENFLRDAENRHKGRLCSYIGYNGDLSHRIYAGSDLFLMPSLFEPCGISQMIAMRYGTLPIVRETGGLKDTVLPYNEFTGEGTGFSFANYNAHEMLGVIRWALGVWRNPDVRKRLITQAMEADFSFDRCARTYAELYRTL